MSAKVKFEDSVLAMDPQDQEFGLRFAKHLRFVFYNSGDEFLYNMVQALRYLNTKKETVAYTTPDKYIYLNAPKGAGVGKVNDKWKFIYIHECLHQIWDTFGVEDKVRKEKGQCSHGLMNIASDCVINDFIYNYFNLDYPTDGLVTPEAIKEDFGVEFDRKKDNQYSLYMKLEPFLKKAEKMPKYKKEFDEAEAPVINIKPQGGGQQQGKTNLIPTTQQYKNGHEKAMYVINRILKDQYANNDANNGDIRNVIAALDAALKEIAKLSGKSSSYTFESLIVTEATVDPQYQTFEQGWEAALGEASKQIKNTLDGLNEALTNPKPQGGNIPMPPMPPMDQNVPDFNETEENLFLPKTLGSFNQPQGGGGESGEGGEGSSDEEIDNMDSQDAADNAQESADRAKDAANKAKQRASQSGSKADKDAADKAQKAAQNAQKAANKAKSAANKGDEEGAQKAAKEARDAANEAEKAAGEGTGNKANMPDEKELGNDPAKGGNKVKKPKPNGPHTVDPNAWSTNKGGGVNIEDLNAFQEDLDEDEMLPADIIERYKKKMSGTIGDFVQKCRKARMEGMGVAAFSPMGKDPKKWQAEFMTSAVNIMRSGITKIQKQYQKTYSRPNRRAGVAHVGQPLKKGRREIKEGTTITMKFFVDRSGSMEDWGVRNVLKAVWSVCDKIKKQYKNNKMIKQFDCLVYPFDENIHKPLAYGEMYTSDNGNCKFSDLLNAMQKVNENTMLNVIITDGRWDVDVSSSLSKIRDIDGAVVVVTNNEDYAAFEKIENSCTKFKLIHADKDWTIMK